MSVTCSFIRCKPILKIFNYYTEASLAELRNLIETKRILPERYSHARVDYDVYNGIPHGDSAELFNNRSFFPLKFFNEDDWEELWISGVTAGYDGTGPRGTIEALKLLGFTLTESQLEELTTVKNVHFTYNK